MAREIKEKKIFTKAEPQEIQINRGGKKKKKTLLGRKKSLLHRIRNQNGIALLNSNIAHRRQSRNAFLIVGTSTLYPAKPSVKCDSTKTHF